MVGRNIAQYELLEKLGEGGMGVVYRARDTQLDRMVAIKILRADRVANADRRLRFIQEAKAASALNHPNIVTIYQAASEDGVDYMAMEFVAGQTVDRLIPPQGMKVPDLLAYAIPVADALARAHAAGIIHRDLKPGNVMVSDDGQVKLLDFGLAKLSDLHEATDADLTQPAPETEAGTILGTVSYMSPEQAEARRVDARSDIFSFGALLYEMASGQRPFAGRSKISTLAAVLQAAPKPLAAIRPELPAELVRIIERCLRKDPARRFQSAADLKVTLTDLQGEYETGEPAAPRRTVSRWWAAAGAVVAATALVTVLAMRVFQPAPAADGVTVRFSFAPERLARGGDTNIDTEVSVSQDGRHITYVEAPGGQLWVRDIDQEKARPVPGATGVYQVFWSPDDRYIGYARGEDLVKIPSEGGSPVPICKIKGQFRRASWSANGETIVFCDDRGLFTVSAAGGAPQRVLEHPHIEHPSFLALGDGRQAFLFQTADAPPRHEIQYMLADGKGGRHTVVPSTSTNPYPVYSGSGHVLYVEDSGDSSAIWAVPFSLSSLKATGSPFPVAQPGSSPSLSRTGTLVYSDPPESRLRLAWYDRAGNVASFVGAPGVYDYPSVSPDGARLAVRLREGGGYDVWMFELNRDLPTRVSFQTTANSPVAWSPSGRDIVYSAFGKNSYDLYTKPANGTGEARPLVTGTANETAPEWSPDQKFLLYDKVDTQTQRDLFYRERKPDGSLSEETPFLHTPFSEGAGRLSPDGRWIAYVSDESGRNEVYLRRFPSAEDKRRISRDGGSSPRWRRDGRELFYVEGSKLMAVALAARPDFTPGQPVMLFSLRTLASYHPQYDVSADGKRFIARQPDPALRPLTIHVAHNFAAQLSSKRQVHYTGPDDRVQGQVRLR